RACPKLRESAERRQGEPAITRSATIRALLAALLFVLLGGIGNGACATERDFYFQRAGGGEALAQNTVTAITQDADGFMWIGTQGGLHRYDGRHYTLYQQDPRVADSLPDSFVTALATDGANGIWIGTYSQYVARLDLDTGHIRHFSGGGGTPEAQRVLALLAESGAVWVGTPLGLERMDPATGARRRLMVLDDPAGARQALARGPDGAIWYATAQGLYRIGADGSSRQMDDAPGLSLLATPAGDLWVGGQDGLWRVRGDGSLVHAWPTDPSSDAGAVNGLAVAPDG